ncbi:hypothetical protein K0M31_016758 [Melipona bicolor]|uniref:Uncharacterized protein n=1 Tax=Melipona bicolor TaxID=60889 RepID=A0AA40FF38_9HYME|nr:hypothetical protein K0M31_016758 [Melipona bicolor]
MSKKRRKKSTSRTRLRTPAKPENLDDSDDQLNASSSSSGIDGGSAPPTLELGVTRRLSESITFRDDPSVPSTSRTHDGHSSKMIANIAGDLTFTSPIAPPTAHYRGAADQVKRSPKHKSARNRLQAHRDDRCQLNCLRIIGNTCFINSAIRSLENITRKEVLRDDNEHHRNRADDIANVPRRHSKIRSVARRNYASAGTQPVARASATIGTVPTAKFDTANDRRRNPIADRVTRVQRQPRFVRRAAGETVREYQGTAKDTPSVQRAPRSLKGYSHPAGPAALVLNLFGILLCNDRETTFRGLIRLIAHDPSYIALARIDTRTFRDVFLMRTLDLRNNTINRIDSNAFLPL